MSTATKVVVKPVPTYVPPKDGKPRDAVDEKWMALSRAALNRSVAMNRKSR